MPKGDQPNDKPTINLFPAPADKATGAGVVIAPGGGYGGVMMTYEGNDVAAWLNTLGISAIVLDYRHAGRGYHHPAPLEDAQRAIRTLRSKAEAWKLDTHKIGILGFSAGGHLASTAGTHFDAGKPDATDPIERLGCRPDFMVLIYPVISLTEPIDARRLAAQSFGRSSRSEIGRKPVERKASNAANAADVFGVQLRGYGGAVGKLGAVLSGASKSESAGRVAHLRKRPTRIRHVAEQPGHVVDAALHQLVSRTWID